jgi:hypothetical protein
MDLPAGIEAAATKFSEVVATYGPKAAEMTLALGKVAALKDLVTAGVGVAGGGALLIWVTRPLVKMGLEEVKNPTGPLYSYRTEREASEGKMILSILGSIASGFSGALLVGINMVSLLNPILWISLARPELYLAAKALNL